MGSNALILLVSCCLTCAQSAIDICRVRTVQKELYRSLHRVVREEAVCSSDRSTTYVELLDNGIPLTYEHFNPGKLSRFNSGSLPSDIIENGLPLVDKVYPAGLYSYGTNTSTSRKGYQFDSLSSTYDYILTHMVLLPKNFSNNEVVRAKYYLQELVPNPERVLRNESELPRLLLYDYYRSHYLEQKRMKDDAIASNRSSLLTQLQFELWGQQKLATLESNTDAAYFKWQMFGYKSEVEKQLEYFDIDTHENKLMSMRALFKSMARSSERDAHVTIFPFTLEPADWFKHLKVK